MKKKINTIKIMKDITKDIEIIKTKSNYKNIVLRIISIIILFSVICIIYNILGLIEKNNWNKKFKNNECKIEEYTLYINEEKEINVNIKGIIYENNKIKNISINTTDINFKQDNKNNQTCYTDNKLSEIYFKEYNYNFFDINNKIFIIWIIGLIICVIYCININD